MDRTLGIGGSDAAAACGRSKWKTRYQLWLEKTGQLPPKVDTEEMRWGRRLEAAILEEYAEREGVQLKRSNITIRHPDIEWMTANLDGWHGNIVVDAKTSRMPDEWGDGGSDEIPEDYKFQGQHYLAVTGLDRVHFPTLFFGSTYKLFDVPRDDEFIVELIAQEHEFWRLVETKTPPTPANEEDCRLRWSTDNGQRVDALAESDIAKTFVDLAHVRKVRRAHKQLEESLRLELLKHLQDDSELWIDGSQACTYKQSKSSTRLDRDKLRDEYPDIYKQVCVTKPGSRRLLFKGDFA